MTSRHQFLTMLHNKLEPNLYVETGVHTGESLRLAKCSAIGIDPEPLVTQPAPAATIFKQTSDDFFASQDVIRSGDLDFGFIDGMHRFEFALRDFMNMEALSRSTFDSSSPKLSVIVFDDVLPYTQYMTNRDMVAGDWTGDVWKVYYILQEHRSHLRMNLVDTTPTGTLLVWELDPKSTVLLDNYQAIVDQWISVEEVPSEILFRNIVVSPQEALDSLP